MDSFYYVPPVVEEGEGGRSWRAKMGHGKWFEEIVDGRNKGAIDKWYREGGEKKVRQ
jgi:hypothetical protein